VEQNSGKHPLDIKSVAKSYDGVKVWPPFSAAVDRNEKIALMGRNGTGKTTLLKCLMKTAPGYIDDAEREFPVDGGQVIWGHNAACGYFAQDHAESIRHGMNTIEWLHQFKPQATQEELRGVLGQMLFTGEEATKQTSALSGGETARLIFCRLMLQKPNVLVLDEPTNHLDLESINALNIALQKYDGTVLLVTHDHDVIDEVATRIWHFQAGKKIEDFKGPYSEFVAAAEEKAS
jgi:ATPase subunit of ABC transporter with duplicated ATPase domains